MTYREYRIQTLKANIKGKKFKVTNSYGAKQAWRWLKKNKFFDIGFEITEPQYRVIINTINQYYQDRLLQGLLVTLPNRMGSLEVRKYATYIKLKNNKIKTNMAIDWDSTLRLWHKDEESYNKKTLVRCEEKERFRIIYSKSKALYQNKIFYEFIPTRDLKIKLKNAIKEQGLDALLLD